MGDPACCMAAAAAAAIVAADGFDADGIIAGGGSTPGSRRTPFRVGL